MRASLAETYFTEVNAGGRYDRAPGLPLLGFLVGTVVGLGLWVIIGLVALRLFV